MSSLLVFDGTLLHSMGDLFGTGEISFGLFSYIFTVFCVVYLINAMNMIDGIDGLSGGIAFVICIFLFSAIIVTTTYFSPNRSIYNYFVVFSS